MKRYQTPGLFIVAIMSAFWAYTIMDQLIRKFSKDVTYCTLANFRHMHVNILLGPPGIKAQSTSGRQNGTYQPLNGVLGRMKTSTQLVV